MSEQLELFPEDPAQDKAADKEKVAKARARAAENEEFKDKRVKSSPLIQQAEVAKMREILAKPRAEKPEQARMKYGNPVMEAAQLKNDVLSLSDDDFGSKYGRDRTAREAAVKDANDRAGYKEADMKWNELENKISRVKSEIIKTNKTTGERTINHSLLRSIAK